MSTGARQIRAATKWLMELYGELDKARTFGLAAQTAFWLFLSLIPLLAVAGLVAARFTSDKWEHLAPVLGTLPESARSLIHHELDRVARWNGGTVGVTGAAVFVWLASTGVHAIFEAFEAQSKAPRTWVKRRFLAVLTCAALSLVVPALAVLGPVLGRVLDRLAPTLWNSAPRAFVSFVSHVVRLTLSFAIAMAYVSALYWIGIPKGRRTPRALTFGALAAVGLQAAMSYGYGLYLSHFTEQAAYGAGLGLVAATLMALYVFALSLLCGAAVVRKLDADHERRADL